MLRGKVISKITVRLLVSSIIILLISGLTSCDGEKKKNVPGLFSDSSSVTQDTVVEEIPEDPFPLINYTLDTIRNREHYREIIRRFRRSKGNFAAFKAFTTLNRKELRFIGVGQAVVIPDTIIADTRAYSVFPYYYPAAKNIKKIVMVSNVYQSYGCYEYGKLVRFAAVNSGKERTPSYPGRYAMSWKEKDHLSSIDSNWHMPYTINFHRQAGSAFHKFTMPGRPASHSCVRQFMDDAEWLYYWADMEKYDADKKPIPFSGTPVIIIDYYDFSPGKGYRWKYLKNNKEKIDYLPDNPLQVEEALIPICQIPLGARGSLVNYKRYLYAEDTLRARGVIRPGVRLIQTRDFNKERREKEKKERERLEKLRQDSIKRMQIKIDSVKNTISPPVSRDSTKVDTLTIIR
jgi:lipoprotein-anchoring transpeptidase ErfK/SrfK